MARSQHPSASDEARIREAILIEAANALLDAGDHSAAIATYDRATALNPNNAAGYTILRGVAKGDKGDYDGAIADYDRAIALNPNDAGFYRNRGFAKYGIRDYNGAIADYDWYPLNRQDGQSQNPYAIAPTKPQPALAYGTIAGYNTRRRASPGQILPGRIYRAAPCHTRRGIHPRHCHRRYRRRHRIHCCHHPGRLHHRRGNKLWRHSRPASGKLPTGPGGTAERRPAAYRKGRCHPRRTRMA